MAKMMTFDIFEWLLINDYLL